MEIALLTYLLLHLTVGATDVITSILEAFGELNYGGDIIVCFNKYPLLDDFKLWRRKSQISISLCNYSSVMEHSDAEEYFSNFLIVFHLEDEIGFSPAFSQPKHLLGNVLSRQYKWIFVLPNYQAGPANDLLKRYPRIPLNVECYLVRYTPGNMTSLANERRFDIWDVYWVADFMIVHALTINDSDYYLLPPLAGRRQDLRGVFIKVVVQFDPDYRGELDVDVINGEITLKSGSAVQMLYDLKDSLNFRFVTIGGKGWISQVPNGTLSGIGSQIITGEADLSVSLSTIASYRAKYLTFLQPTTSNRLYVTFRQPREGQHNDILTSPFEDSLYIYIMGLWTSVLVALIFITEIQHRYAHRDSIGRNDVLMWTIYAICNQSWTVQPTNASLRILLLTVMFAGLILYAVYSAQIISALSIQSPIIKTFADLVKKNYILLSRPNVGFLQSLIEDAETLEKIMKKFMRHYVNESQSVKDVIESNERVGQLAYLTTFYTIARNLNYTEQTLCSVSKLTAGSFRSKTAFFVRKGSEYTKLFNYKTVVILQNGLNNRYTRIFLRGTYASCEISLAHNRPLEFSDCVFAFEALLIGLLLAVMLQSLEKIYELLRPDRVM